jgi:chromosome segregation ATPase
MSRRTEQVESSYLTKELHSQLCKKIAQLVKVIYKLSREIDEHQLQNSFLRQELAAMKILRAENASLAAEVLSMKQFNSELEQKHAMEIEEMKKSHETERNVLQDLFMHKSKEMEESLQSQNYLMKEKEKELKKKNLQVENIERKLKQLLSHQDECSQLNAKIKHLKDHLEETREHAKELKEEKQNLADALSKLVASKSQLEKDHETILQKNKNLSGQLKSTMSHAHLPHKQSRSLLLPQRKEVVSPGILQQKGDLAEEVERLRNEVQRYRLELMNRESNFNRIFVQHSPVTLDHQVRV